jgi:hypothetical protein
MLVCPDKLLTTTANAATFVTTPCAAMCYKHLSNAAAMLALLGIHVLDQLPCLVGMVVSQQ